MAEGRARLKEDAELAPPPWLDCLETLLSGCSSPSTRPGHSVTQLPPHSFPRRAECPSLECTILRVPKATTFPPFLSSSTCQIPGSGTGRAQNQEPPTSEIRLSHVPTMPKACFEEGKWRQ